MRIILKLPSVVVATVVVEAVVVVVPSVVVSTATSTDKKIKMIQTITISKFSNK